MTSPDDQTTPHGAGGPPPPPSGSTPGATPPPATGAAWGAAPPHPSGLPSDVRGWAIAAHLGGLLVGVLSAATLGFLAPLIVWLTKRDDHPFLEHHGKEALNFQLTVLTAAIAGAVLAIPALLLGIITFGLFLVVAVVVVVAAAVAWFVLPIVASVKASNGEGYRYPLTIRYVS